MKVVLISTNKKKTTAEIVVIENGKSTTKHVVLGQDGLYHHLLVDNQGKLVLDTTYTL